MGCCSNAAQNDQARAMESAPGAVTVNQGTQLKPLNIYTKSKLTGVMNEACQEQQDNIEQNFDPEATLYLKENIESKRSELEMQAIYEN